MKAKFTVMVLVLLVTSLFSKEVAPILNIDGEAFDNRQGFYFPVGQDEGVLYYTLDKQKIVEVTDNDIRLISLKEKRVVKIFDVTGEVSSITFTKDGHYLLLNISSDSTVKVVLLDLEKEELISLNESWEEGECDSSDIVSVDMTLDGKYIVYVENQSPFNRVIVWDIASRKVIKKFSTHGSRIQEILISGTDAIIATKSNEKQVDIWSIEGKHLNRFKLKKDDRLVEFELSDNGKYLLMNDEIRETNGTKVTRYLKDREHFYFSLSPNSKDFLFYGTDESILSFGDVKEKKIVKTLELNNSISFVDVSLNRAYITVMLENSNRVLIDSETREIVTVFSDNDEVKDIFLTKDSKQIVKLMTNSELIVQDIKSGKISEKIMLIGTPSISSVQLTKNGKYLFAIDVNKHVHFWDVENSKLLGGFSNKKLTDNFFITANDKYLVLETDENTMIWDIEHQKELESKFTLDSDLSSKMDFSHSKYLLSLSDENSIELYSIDDMKSPIKEFVVGGDGSWVVFDYLKKRMYRGGEKSFPLRAKRVSPNLGIELMPF